MFADTAATITAVGVAASAILSALATLIGVLTRRSIRTPSGDPIGHVAERTHDLAAVAVKDLHGIRNGHSNGGDE